jgi:hypothetical protein
MLAAIGLDQQGRQQLVETNKASTKQQLVWNQQGTQKLAQNQQINKARSIWSGTNKASTNWSLTNKASSNCLDQQSKQQLV